jgi:hypothetical protein
MAYGCVRTDNMAGTVLGSGLVPFKYQPSSGDTAIENGNVVVIGGYISGQREVRTADTPAADSKFSSIVLVASEEVVKEKNNYFINEFRNEAGAVCRGYRLHPGDIFSISAECFAAGSVLDVGSVVELAAGTKLKAVASLTAGSTQIGKIIAVEGQWYVIEVIPATVDVEGAIESALATALNGYVGTADLADYVAKTDLPNLDILKTIPVPEEGDEGKVIKVNHDEDGYELGVDQTGEQT